MRTIKEGEHVLIKVENGDDIIVQVNKGASIKVKKVPYKLDHLIGNEYYSHFELDLENKNVNLTTKNPFLENTIENWKGDYKSVPVETDNRNLMDDGKSQKFSIQEIEVLKKEVKDKDELIGKIIEGSTTFTEKTKFSQEKYIKKKKKV